MAKGYIFPSNNLNDTLDKAFDTSSGHSHNGTDSRKISTSNITGIVGAGKQGFLATTCTVALAAIAATDVVVANVVAYATTAYVTKVAITAGTGFVVTLNQDAGNATISYLVFNAI
jgi:hypothetical protein